MYFLVLCLKWESGKRDKTLVREETIMKQKKKANDCGEKNCVLQMN